VRRFLEKQVPAAGTKEGRFIPLETVDDFLAFDAARRFALTKEVPAEIARYFDLEFAPDMPALGGRKTFAHTEFFSV
jgi:hypothetical protein